jgi:hypothetical protein
MYACKLEGKSKVKDKNSLPTITENCFRLSPFSHISYPIEDSMLKIQILAEKEKCVPTPYQCSTCVLD